MFAQSGLKFYWPSVFFRLQSLLEYFSKWHDVKWTRLHSYHIRLTRLSLSELSTYPAGSTRNPRNEIPTWNQGLCGLCACVCVCVCVCLRVWGFTQLQCETSVNRSNSVSAGLTVHTIPLSCHTSRCPAGHMDLWGQLIVCEQQPRR